MVTVPCKGEGRWGNKGGRDQNAAVEKSRFHLHILLAFPRREIMKKTEKTHEKIRTREHINAALGANS